MKIPFPKNERTQIDPFYRYKRDTLVIEKSGQFFVLKNIINIATDIGVKIDEFIKYLQKKIGQTIIYDKNINTYKIKNNTNDIEKYLEQYIVETLVCKKCNLPEIKDNKKCAACGNIN